MGDAGAYGPGGGGRGAFEERGGAGLPGQPAVGAHPRRALLRGGRDGAGAAFTPPQDQPAADSARGQGLLVAIRRELDRDGHDAGAGAETIAFHLQRRHGHRPSVSTIWRILRARGFVAPQPHRRPKSSCHRLGLPAVWLTPGVGGGRAA